MFNYRLSGILSFLCYTVTLVTTMTALQMSSAGLVGLTLKGSYNFHAFASGEDSKESYTYHFKAYLFGCSWTILYEGPTQSTVPDLVKEKCIASCDGTNIYICEYQLEEMDRKAWGDRYPSVKDELPVALAEIFPGNYPPKTQVLQLLCLALAPQCLMDREQGTTRAPYPQDLAMFYHTNHPTCRYKWRTHADGTREIVFIADGHALYRDFVTGELSDREYPAPYDSGFTNAIGFYRQWTNIHAVSLPMNFELTAYAPRGNGRTAADLRKINHLRCEISDISTSGMEKVPAELPRGKVIITDRRFARSGTARVSYVITNGSWPIVIGETLRAVAAASPKMSFEEETVHEMGITREARSNLWRYLIWILLALPLGLLVAKGVAGKLNNKKRKEGM